MAGTAELIALELGRLLEPLQTRLEAGELAALFEEDLGLPLPQAVRDAPEVITAGGQTVDALLDVAEAIGPLADAIASGDTDLIAEQLSEFLPLATEAFERVASLATQVRTAYESLGPVAPVLQDIVSQLPVRLLNFLVVSYLESGHPILGHTLGLFGLIESVLEPAQPHRPAYLRRAVRLDRLATIIVDPAQTLRDVYGWGDLGQPLDAGLLLLRVREFLAALDVPVAIEPDLPRLRTLAVAVEPGAGLPTPLELTLDDIDLTGVDQLLLLSDRWTVRLRASGALDLGVGLRIEPPARVTPTVAAPNLSGELSVSFERSAPGPGPDVMFGAAVGTRLTTQAIKAGFGAAFAAGAAGVTAELLVEAEIVDGQLVLQFGGADGFLSTFLPAESRLDFDIGVRWSRDEGLLLRGGVGLLITVPLTVEIGPLRLNRLDVMGGLVADGLGAETRITGGIALGPFDAAVEGIGVGVGLSFREGNLGPVDLTFRFLAPRGLGLSIDAGPVQGGGFILFDEPAGRYAGVFQVSISAIGVSAIGLLDTKLPGGGFALLIVLRAEFPAIQLGFGFALTSVGGLLALNRRIDVDVLRVHMAAGAAGRILAPEDPIRNAPILIQDLSAVFPATPGVIVVGPTLQLTWAGLVRFDIGIFIELPGPTKIVLLGSARLVVDNPGGGGPVVQIRLDILGVLDFAKRALEFDAVLIDSVILEVLEISGGAAFRLSWGDEPYVLLSVGGFHPAFSPAPLVVLPTLTRVAMTRGNPQDFIYLRFEGYFAVTTNTLQFGASVEVAVNAGPLNARGFLGFDALIRFDPFFFQFNFEASFRVRLGSFTLAALTVQGELSGPGPITFHGSFCIEILFFEICFEGTFSIGSEQRPVATPIASAVTELATELAKPANLSVGTADDRYAVVEPDPGAPLPVVSPLGQVTWAQSRAPLNLLLQRFEGSPLAQPETVTATGGAVTGSASEWFPPGSFAELSDGDALNRRAFERLDGGVRLGAAGLAQGSTRAHEVTVRQIRLPQILPVPGFAFAVPGWLIAAVGNRTGHVERVVVVGAVSVREEGWQVRGGDGTILVDRTSESQAHQLVAAGVGAAALPTSDQVDPISF
jgi:hypothetical protein